MSGASTWAVVPVKSLGDAKQRLAFALPLAARRKLMLVMLEDVLATLSQVEGLEAVLVVTPDPLVREIAMSHDARVLREDRISGHSAAAIAGFAEARANGATQALALPADAPLVTTDELRSLLAASELSTGLEPRAARIPFPLRGGGGPMAPQVTLVPSRDGDGTNGILVSPPDGFPPSFGPGSFSRHLAYAAEHGLPCRTVDLPGLALDIDEPHDLRELMRYTRSDPRYAFLHAYGLVPAGADER
jgi:2-phospho-L-lactate/phosphoenolpyruvate guanylyltransferase